MLGPAADGADVNAKPVRYIAEVLREGGIGYVVSDEDEKMAKNPLRRKVDGKEVGNVALCRCHSPLRLSGFGLEPYEAAEVRDLGDVD